MWVRFPPGTYRQAAWYKRVTISHKTVTVRQNSSNLVIETPTQDTHDWQKFANDLLASTRADAGVLVVKIIPNRAELARRLAGRGRRHLREGSVPIHDLVQDRVREDLQEGLQ